ncbi:MAG: HD domain-containing protein [Proteobacteria bacterium]|nr:HD domain-containing protein [Pseudomonadota bacterium]
MSQNIATKFKGWLTKSPYASKAFWVGGCLRDAQLGKIVTDWDMVVEEEGGAKGLAHWLHENYPSEVSTPYLLGSRYPIWQVIVENLEIQIADTHQEKFPSPESRQREIFFAPLLEDCKRRDFTMNMLYQNVSSGEFLDPSGCALEDISKLYLRCHPQSSTYEILDSDPLRLIRLFRFAALLKAKIDPELIENIKKTKARLKILSAERVRDELIKAAENGVLGELFDQFKKHQILEELFDEFLPMIGCGQDKIYHSEGDVWVHTLMVVANARQSSLLQFAALFHDIGKPSTRSEHGERIKFLGHEVISEKLAQEFFMQWHFPQDFSKRVCQLIRLHLRGGDVQNWKSLKPARKFLRDSNPLTEELLQLIEADSRASLGADGKARLEHIPILREKIKEASAQPISSKAILDGHEIMSLLKIKAGPELKKIQTSLIEAEDEHLSEFKEWNKEIASQWLKKCYKTS